MHYPKNTQTVNRPNGNTVPRCCRLKKGDLVAIWDTYPLSVRDSGVVKPIHNYDWIFISHWSDSKPVFEQYGWVPANGLVNCQAMEGTP
jgi:hypothetical protein